MTGGGKELQVNVLRENSNINCKKSSHHPAAEAVVGLDVIAETDVGCIFLQSLVCTPMNIFLGEKPLNWVVYLIGFDIRMRCAINLAEPVIPFQKKLL